MRKNVNARIAVDTTRSAYPVSSALRSCGRHSGFHEERPRLDGGWDPGASGQRLEERWPQWLVSSSDRGFPGPAVGPASTGRSSVHSSRLARAAVVWAAE